MKKFLLTILITLLVPSLAYAQTNSTDDVNSVLQSIESERIQKLEQQLGLNLPLETDNPNHIITFKDPSGKGVKLEIDGQGYKTIKSPYTLPALGIGSHQLSFKFTDDQDTSQTLEKSLVVVPRPPVISAPETVTTKEITIKGTALASSTVELFISGNTLNFKASAPVSTDGAWSYTFKENFKYTVYTVTARTKKNGFSSNLSEPVVFELTTNETQKNDTNSVKPIYFDFRSINATNAFDTIKNNPQLLILMLVPFVFGAVISWIIESVSTRKVNKTAEGKFIKLLNDKEKEKKKSNKQKDMKDNIVNNEDKKLTLKEKFEKAGFKVPENKIEEKTLNKEEFLEVYKEEDPDDKKGREKKETHEEGESKKVAVTLTSTKKRS